MAWDDLSPSYYFLASLILFLPLFDLHSASNLSFRRKGTGKVTPSNSGFGWPAEGHLLGLPLVVLFLSASFSVPRLTSEAESKPGRWRRAVCLALPDVTREAGWPPTVHKGGRPAGVSLNSGIETRGLYNKERKKNP